MLGQLCTALWESQSRPDVIQPGIEPGTLVTPLALRCSVLDRCSTREPQMYCFTESWLSQDILSESVQPIGFSVHRADRNKYLSGKKKGGGVCFMINYSWCDSDNIQELKSFCSPYLEYLTIKFRLYYLKRILFG
jgi:hypothetical protein